jgi:dsDNA-specific endonuclease/ATPase MutS2
MTTPNNIHDLATTEIDLHGMRLEEAESEVLKFIDRLYYHGETSGRIIHGIGIISTKLPEWLRNYPYVRDFQCPPFNRGVTVVFLDVA